MSCGKQTHSADQAASRGRPHRLHPQRAWPTLSVIREELSKKKATHFNSLVQITATGGGFRPLLGWRQCPVLKNIKVAETGDRIKNTQFSKGRVESREFFKTCETICTNGKIKNVPSLLQTAEIPLRKIIETNTC